MRKILTLLLALCLCLGLAACAGEAARTGEEKPEVVATLFPAWDFARQIGGERVTATLLVPPGGSGHSYEPTPRDVLRLENCALLVYNGGESEAWVETLLSGREREIPALRMMDCVRTLEEETVEGMRDLPGEPEEGPEYDEHVWTSPVNAKAICRALCESLCRADPAGEAEYRENLRRYEQELDALDAAFRQAVEGGKRKTLIFADRFPARYFTEEYGLDYYAAFPGCAEDAEPSARTVAFLIDKVEREGIPAVFTIEFSNGKMADVICEDTGCEKLLFHSCHSVSAEELSAGAGYLELMWANVESIREALA